MAKTRTQRKDEDIGRRSRWLARQLQTRLFASEQLVAVSGEPDFRRLCGCLQRVQVVPAPGRSPTPFELGFAPGGVTPISKRGLAGRGRALQKWRTIIEDREKLKKQDRADREKLRRWKAEVADLAVSLRHGYRSLERLEQSPRELSTAYLLDDLQQAEMDRLIKAHSRARVVPPLWEWYARVAAWCGGVEAAHCMFEALAPFLDTEQQQADRQCLSRLSRAATSRFADDHQAAECILSLFHSLPGEVIERFGIPPPQRPHDIRSYLELLKKRCAEGLAGLPPSILDSNVAALAAFSACQKGTSPYPWRLLRAAELVRPEQSLAFHAALLAEATLPGYELLVAALNDSKESRPSADELDAARRVLLAGAQASDVAWVRGYRCLKGFAAKGISPRPLRLLIEKLAALGARGEEAVIGGLVDMLAGRGDTAVVEAFCERLSHLTVVTPTLAHQVWCAYRDAAELEGISPRFRAFLRRWVAPPKRLKPMPDCPPNLSSGLQRTFDEIAYYQRLSGQAPSLPGSLRDRLSRPDREREELEHLRLRDREGRLTPSMRRRLELLESREHNEYRLPARRLVRQAAEMLARQSFDVLRQHQTAAVRALWDELVAAPPPGHLTTSLLVKICAWMRSLPADQSPRLREILDAWRRAGPRYREAIGRNARWLAQASQHGVHVEAWLYPASALIYMGDARLRIHVAEDPFRTFLMGSYFGTCLSIDGGSNRESVLANARDANKAVVYATGPDGHVIARKLVCVSSEFRMIGFMIYVSAGEADREPIADAIDAYCGRWARAANLALANFGEPRGLDDAFWYDDGVEPWKPAAFAAWETGPDGLTALAGRGGGAKLLHPSLAAALRMQVEAGLRLLADFGIGPAGVEASYDWLETQPELAEEVLAIVARQQRDASLAERVFDHSRGKGGRYEALTSLAILRGDTFIKPLLDHAPSIQGMSERCHQLLLHLDTQKSLERLIELALDHTAASEWVPIAAGRSAHAAGALTTVLSRRKSLPGDPYPVLAGFEMLMRRDPNALRDAVMERMIRVSTEDPDQGDVWAEVIVCWRPRFRRPAHVLDLDLLNALYAVASPCRWPWQGPYTRAAVLLAAANPCPASIRFLRERAADDHAAMLALALAAPKRFSTVILDLARKDPKVPATMMAVFAVKGLDAGTSWLQEQAGAGPGYVERLAAVRRLFEGCTALDFARITLVPDEIPDSELAPCVPLLMRSLWSHLDAVEAGEPPMHFSVPDAIPTGLRSVGHMLSNDAVFGIGLRLASYLATASGEHEAKIRSALSDLSDRLGQGCLGSAALLQIASDHRLTCGVEGRRWVPHCQPEDLVCLGAGWYWLFDEHGHRRTLANQEWLVGRGHCPFPVEPAHLKAFAEFLAGKCRDNDLVARCEPATEITRRLLQRFASSYPQ